MLLESSIISSYNSELRLHDDIAAMWVLFRNCKKFLNNKKIWKYESVHLTAAIFSITKRIFSFNVPTKFTYPYNMWYYIHLTPTCFGTTVPYSGRYISSSSPFIVNWITSPNFIIFRTFLCEYQLLTYLLTYTMEQSPSWEANWFCS